jgi:hypothetical protein
MIKSNRYPVAMIAGLLIAAAAPAFAQTPETPTQKHSDKTESNTVRPAGAATENSDTASATEQKTQGDITEVGPGSKAYFGNTQHSKY